MTKAVYTYHRYTCDRCSVKSESGIDQCPDGWTNMLHHRKRDTSRPESITIDLCSSCSIIFHDWMKGAIVR